MKKKISKESENIIKEFYEVDKVPKQKQTYVLTTKSHPQAYHTSRLLDFTKKLNKILNQDEKERTSDFECLNQEEKRILPPTEGLDCIITDLKQLGMYKKVNLFYYTIIIINWFFLFRY